MVLIYEKLFLICFFSVLSDEKLLLVVTFVFSSWVIQKNYKYNFHHKILDTWAFWTYDVIHGRPFSMNSSLWLIIYEM
jgi:hypothetical protein